MSFQHQTSMSSIWTYNTNITGHRIAKSSQPKNRGVCLHLFQKRKIFSFNPPA
jgi:hypothetical protein